MTLEVIEAGLLLTVQDMGRPGHEHLGVPRAGAADTRSLALANRLAGNPPGAAALEATLLGPRLRALRDVTVGIAGAHLEPVLQPGGRPIDASRPIRLAAAEELAFLEAGDPARGCRAYIAVAGGIDVPVILGSRSTSLVGAFGGFHGRALRARDVVTARDARSEPSADPARVDDTEISIRSPGRPIAIIPGPTAGELDGAKRLRALLDTKWIVGLDSDRRGLRLEPVASTGIRLAAPTGDRPSHGVVVGTIQLTPSGQPLVLMPDGGTTGGYPVVAIVTSDDVPLLGQLTPGAEIRFWNARVRLSE